MLKKLITIVMLSATLVAVYAKAVGLGWNPYSDAAVNTIKVYIAPGLTSFASGGVSTANTNVVGLITTNVAATATSVTINVPFSGPWSAVATALTTNGVESVNSNLASTNLPPGAPISLRFQ
jgi:hypothetical protein